jgi:hypothetical protein
MIKNDEWLNKGNNRKAITMTAVRIPVQGLNSMEFMEVYEFLDPAAGNIIIPPSEIVAKSGADFDVDKLTTFMPNIDSSGHYIETSMNAEDLDKKVAEAKKNKDKSEVSRLIKMQKAALENRLISSIQGILSLPDNYATLVRPNDTYLLQEIADDLIDTSPEYKEFKTISPTNVLEVGYNLHKHEANMIGKDVLGIIALENSLHPLLTSLGAALPKTYKQQKWSGDKYVEVPQIDFEMRLLLNHNKTDDGRISLSKINSVDNQDKIADLISHLMNGSVDVEKDAWIFFIQANKEIVPVLLSLLKAGVPKREAVYFVSQPLVKEYAKQQRLIGSAYSKVTGNDVDNISFVKYQALQNTLASTTLNEYSLRKEHPNLLRDASLLKIKDSLKASTEDISITLSDDKVVKYTKTKLLADLEQNKVPVQNIAEIKDEYDEEVYKPVSKDFLTSNENWYYTTQVLTKGVEKFTENELLDNITKNNTQSNDALAAFLHFIEFEKEIKGLSNLKRQANPDTKTSKTIQEITQKTLSLDEAADSSKIDPALAEKLQKESILGTFFDKDIIRDIITPLFNVTNDEEVSQFIIDDIARSGGRITKKFGPGKDGVEAFITAYKNAIINYIYQNKLSNIISSEESFPGIPESLTDINAPEFVESFMEMISENAQLKEMYPILEQLTDIPVRNKKKVNNKDVVTNIAILTLNNKSAVKGELAEAYHQNLIDLADDNVIKVKDPVKNKEISDMFKALPLMSILQNGVGNTKHGLSYVLPDTTYFEILEPASREFLALDKQTKLKTLFAIDNLLFENGQGENNYILSRADAKKFELQGVVKDEKVEEPESTQPQANNSDNIKTPREGLDERLDNYGYARIVLSSDFNEGARPNGRLNAFKEAVRLAAQNPTALMDINLNEFDFITNDEKKRLDALRPLAKEFQKINLLISGAEFRTVAVEKRFAQLTNQLTNEFVDIVGKHVEQQLGKTISTSKPRILTQQQAPAAEVNFEENQTGGYPARTRINASADATIHLAINFETPGEKLTKKSVNEQGKTYIALNASTLNVTPERVNKLVDILNSKNIKTLNIAGNGIYDMKQYTQEQVDEFTYQLLNAALNSPNLKIKITGIRSGGQTGFDEAGAKAGMKLGIPTTVLAPKDWEFRTNRGNVKNEEAFKARFKTNTQQEAPVTEVETDTDEEPEINKNIEAFNAEMINNKGRMPKEFIVGPSKWVLNNMNLYDLVDKNNDSILMKNMNMFTGDIVEEIKLEKPVNQKQLFNFTKQLASGVKEYKLDQLLALKGIDIEDVYGAINKLTTQDQLNNLINKILKAIC